MDGGANFLRSVRLYSTKADAVTEGKIQGGHYGSPGEGDKIQDLGETVDALVVAVREQALDFRDRDNVKRSNRLQDPLFQEIKANEPDDTQCGTSWLLYVRELGGFAELFLANKSHKPKGKELMAYLPELPANGGQPGAVTLGVEIAESKKYRSKWQVPTVSKCDRPFTDLPDADAFNQERERFLAPTKAVEEVEAPADAR